MALSITGLLLVLGIQVSFSGPRPPWSAKPVPVSAVRASAPAPVSASTSHVVSLASTTWETPAPMEQPPAPAPAAPLLPKAPKLRVKSLGDALTPTADPKADAGSVDGLIAGYTAAYDSARTRLEAGMRVTRLNQLFAPARLMPNGGLTETRLSLAGAANFIRVYRQQETTIERQFQDSFTLMARNQKWSTKVARRWHSRPALKEPAALCRDGLYLPVRRWTACSTCWTTRRGRTTSRRRASGSRSRGEPTVRRAAPAISPACWSRPAARAARSRAPRWRSCSRRSAYAAPPGALTARRPSTRAPESSPGVRPSPVRRAPVGRGRPAHPMPPGAIPRFAGPRDWSVATRSTNRSRTICQASPSEPGLEMVVPVRLPTFT